MQHQVSENVTGYESLGQAIIDKLGYLIDEVLIITDGEASNTYEDVCATYAQGYLNISDAEHPPYLTRETNILLRAIHDVVHAKYGYDFTLWGETCAYNTTCSLLGVPEGGVVDRFLYSEIVMQAKYYTDTGGFMNEQVVNLKAYDLKEVV